MSESRKGKKTRENMKKFLFQIKANALGVVSKTNDEINSFCIVPKKVLLLKISKVS